MLRQLAKDTLVYSVSGFLTKAISFLLLPFYTRFLAKELYGIADLVQGYSLLGMILFSLEIIQAFARYYIDDRDEGNRLKIASTVFVFSALASAVFFALNASLSGIIVPRLLGDPAYTTEFVSGILAAALYSILNTCLFMLRYRFEATRFLIVSVVYTVSTSCISVLLVLVFKLGILGYFVGQVAGASIGLAIAIPFNSGIFNLRVDRDILKKLLHFSVPLVPSSLGVITASYIDRLMIKQFMSLSDVSVYGVAARFAMIVSFLVSGFAAALNPLIIKGFRNPQSPGQIAKLFQLFLGAALWCVLFFMQFAGDIISIMATKAFSGATVIIPILTFSSLFMSMYLFFPGLTFAGKTKMIAAINIAGAIMNSVLNYFLIPRLGILGAAIANSTNAIFVFGCYVAFSSKYYRIPVNIRRVSLTGGVFCALAIITIGLRGITQGAIAAWALKVSIMLLASLGLILMLSRTVHLGAIRRSSA